MAFLAAAEGAELAEGAEGAEGGGKESFSPDSESNAADKGVEIAKAISSALSLASSVLSLVATIKKGKEAAEDIKDQRYEAGILTKDESRGDLLRKGLIPAYYSDTSIRGLIREDKTPAGWTTATLVGQGFGPAVALQKGRQRARTEERQGAEAFARRAQRAKVIRAQKLAEDKKESAMHIQSLRSSVVI